MKLCAVTFKCFIARCFVYISSILKLLLLFILFDAEVITNLLRHHPRKKPLLNKVTHRSHFGICRAAVHENVWLAAMSMEITVNDNLERNVLSFF